MPSLGDTQLNIQIRTEANNTGINQTKEGIEGLGGGLGRLAGAFAIGNIASNVMMNATAKLGEAFTRVKDQAKEHAMVEAQLGAVLASTGGAAGVTKDKANQLAEAISKNTAIDNEAALAAENMLLTFTNIHANVFPQTTRAVTDMATAMNGGATPSAEQLRQTAIQVGKALNDPAVGMTKLQKIGVTFTEQQKEQIKTMEKAGNLTGAQTVILNELAKEFGGSASAAATTFSGKMQQLKNHLIDLGGNGLTKLGVLLNELTQQWLKHRAEIENIANKVIAFLRPSFEALMHTIEGMMPTLKILWNDVLKPLSIVIGITLVAALWLFINILNVTTQAIRDVVNWGKNVGDALVNAWNWIVGAWNGAVGFFSNLGARIGGVFYNTWTAVRNSAAQVVDDIVNFFATLPRRALAAVGNIGQAIGNDIKGALHSIHIPGFASGVTNFSGGLALVGENGPELVNLPSGSSVYPNGTAPSGSGGGHTFNFGDIHLGDAGAVNQFAGWVRQLDQDTVNVGRGLTSIRGAF